VKPGEKTCEDKKEEVKIAPDSNTRKVLKEGLKEKKEEVK
jgi:hypothetical protein